MTASKDDLEIPPFLRRPKGEPLPPWSPPKTQANAPAPRKTMDEATAAFVEAETARKKAKAKARIAKMLADKAPKPDTTGMRWDPNTAQWIPDFIPSTDPARSKIMSRFSEPQSVKSNARRSAIKAGVDPSKVIAAPGGGFYYPLPGEAAPSSANRKAAQRAKAKVPAKAKAAKAAKPKKTKAAKASREGSGAKFEQVAAMLRKPGGAAMSTIVKATDWLPHTARARISVNVSKLLAKGEVIQRTRPEKGGESVYAIVPDKQRELPL